MKLIFAFSVCLISIYSNLSIGCGLQNNLIGNWKNEINAKIISLNCNNNIAKITAYQITPISVVAQSSPTVLTEEDLSSIHLNLDGSLRVGEDVYYEYAEEIQEHPTSNANSAEICTVMTSYFKQHYPFFKLHGINYKDWSKKCVMTPDDNSALFTHLSKMLAEIGDNHLMLAQSLDGSGKSYFNFKLRESFAKELQKEIDKYNKDKGAQLTPSDYIDNVLLPEALKILDNNLDAPKIIINDKLFAGYLKNYQTALYINISSMEIESEDIDKLMTFVMPMINNPKTTSVIIDLRFNMGGNDEIGQKVLSYFISEKRKIYSRKTFYAASKWTVEKNILITPSPQNNTTTPIRLLIGPITASAAETFALGMKTLPQVKIIGENSMGIFSDQFPRILPNGWWITLSNELLLSPDKLSYEGIGVPVNYQAAFPFLSTLGNNLFPGIDAAVQSSI